MEFSLSEVHPSWHEIFTPLKASINEVLRLYVKVDIAPTREDIFRAFSAPLTSFKVVIFGQDPYPGEGVADGFAFSSRGERIPASLRNIFKELHDDLNIETPSTPNLAQWQKNGVLLLNRTLTTEVGASNSHRGKKWNFITNEIARELGKRDVVAILWGANARELAPLFKYSVESVHPSPLSARNGFFGSKPFSRVNALIESIGKEPIDWSI